MRSAAPTTDGWRGLTGTDFAEPHLLGTLEHAATTGLLHRTVLIGYDSRGGAREVAALAADLLTSHGLTCVLATGPAPTPAVARAVRDLPHIDAAIIITASHNPPGYLGVKVRDSHGHGVLWPLPPITRSTPIDLLPVSPQSHAEFDVLSHYAQSVGNELMVLASRFDGHVIIDAAHGAVGAAAPYLPALTWRRARPLPFFAGLTPDPACRPQADHLAAAILNDLPERDRALIVMVDGDGDRLALYTARSGYIASPEQAAVLIAAGLDTQRLITTAVSPRAVTDTAQEYGVHVDFVQVGFKHIVAKWQTNPALPSLGLEPNGALVWTADHAGYFERDSLAALSTILSHLPSVDALDGAVAAHREDHPHPQRIITSPQQLGMVLDQLRPWLSTWEPNMTSDGVMLFDHGPDQRIAVRASGTEPGTRLYIEAPATLVERIATEINASG